MWKDYKKAAVVLIPYMWKYWKAYLGLFLLMILDIGLTLIYAWFFGTITDAAVQGNFQKLAWLVPVGIALTFLNLATGYWHNVLEFIATVAVKKDLKEHLLKHVLLLTSPEIANLRSGAVLTHFTQDIHGIDGLIGGRLIELIRLPVIFFAVLMYMVQIHWMLAVLSIVAIPVALISGAVFGTLLRRNHREMNQMGENLISILSETFLGTFVVRAFALEKKFYNKYTDENKKMFALETKVMKQRSLFGAGGSAAGAVAFLISLCLGAYFVSNQVITIGSLLTFVNLTNHLIYPLTGLAGLWAGFQSSLTSMERLINILEKPADHKELPTYETPRTHSASIAFEDVTFGFNEDQPIFRHFHLNIPSGLTVAIVGASGAGKTTLFQLILGFYKPITGRICINGTNIHDMSPSLLKSYLAHVPQDPFLFSGSVRENLMLARPGITEEEMMTAAKHANIHEFLMSLPDGYDTQIGERGLKLSGGQKQRIAIARAILKDAPILLLDEATSALDSETEHQVQEALHRLTQDRTTLIIAHRLSTVQNADLIIVLEHGNIVQMGKHEELMKKEGAYRRLALRQAIDEQEGDITIDDVFHPSVV